MEGAVSFVTQNINLKGNVKQPVHQPRMCNRCNEMRVPEGGIEMRPGRWICAACWTNKVIRRPSK
jgi:formylmethanofuran dehydrogenase subunit E